MAILGFSLPAKGGVTVNIITSVLCIIVGVWGAILSIGLFSKVNEFINGSMGFNDREDKKNIALGRIFFFVGGLILQFISIVISMIGATRRKEF